ncbi:MAG: AsmA-like C-terminal domain-containing protein [Thermodesulfobacteriota bacterium]
MLIESQKVKDQILTRINSWYVVDASVQDISFTWFPFPHIKVGQVEVLHQDFSVTSPEATLYPSWKILLGLSSLGRLDITDPVFHLHDFSPSDKDDGLSTVDFPEIKLVVDNGTLLLPEQHNSLFASQKIFLNKISADFSIRGKGGEFSWKSEASFAKKMVLSGKFDRKGQGTMRGEVQDLRSQKILTAKGNPLLKPLNDISTLSFTAEKNLDGLILDLSGDIPDFSLSRLDVKENFRLGKGDINLHLGPHDSFFLTFNDLHFHEPQLKIKGEISRYFPDGSDQSNIKIDLKAADLDLTGVRQKVLSLLGDNSVAQQVCDIVQSGKANSATYYFDAPAKAFEDVASMTIGVDIATSEIHLADIPLDLNNAQGPILIKDGDLSGKNITTWVGDAKGTDGVFLVGLASDKFGLEVDVDIDANLQELPAVLRSILNDKDVARELGKVQGSGRANGHLHIGDDIRDFNVIVDVDTYHDAELRYERLSWPLRPTVGKLKVTGTSATWQNMKAKMASHSIQETSGHVTWDDPDIPFSINSLHGLFDTNTLLGELKEYPLLMETFAGVIDSIQGSAEITGSLQGSFFKPEEYTYSFESKLKDITFKTPVMAEKVMVEKATGIVGHQEIKIVSSAGTLFGKPINLSGELLHDDWQTWEGNLHVNGLLGNKHLNWLEDKHIFPHLIVPRPPYRIRNMTIRWDDKLFSLEGKLSPEGDTIALDLDIKNKAESFSGSFHVKSETDNASLTLHWNEKDQEFISSFKGNISGGSLGAFLDDSKATFESIKGDFKIHKTTDKKTNMTMVDFDGDLIALDAQWTWGKEQRVCNIPILNFDSEDSRLRVQELEAVFNNESFGASGVFSSKPGLGHFELDLFSVSPISTTNIEKFQDDLDYFLYTTLAIPQDTKTTPSYEISGLLGFDFKSVVLPFGTKRNDGGDQRSYKLPITPLKGTYEFNQTDSELNLQDSEVCGVGLNGQLSWHGPQETTKEISVMSPIDRPLKFQDFLSCFNFDGIVEGPLEISGRIYSDTNLCKRGGVFLTSKKGTIKKFVALAKTLSLINITGLSGAIWKEGFYYNAFELSGNICDNVFTIEKAFIDGDGVDVVATGEVNLSTMEYDVTFFVVPFATIHGLVTKVPLVGRVLGGSEGRIVSVPVKVTGPLHDPKVTVLSPSAIGEATGKWILDTITLPFGWMIPGKKDRNGEQNSGPIPNPQESTDTSSSSESPAQ